MKKLFRNFVLDFLIKHARRRVPENAKIVAITGSVGKTTAKDAIAKILATRYRTIATRGNLNSEFGVPLTLLDEESGFSSFWKWLGVLWRVLRKTRQQLTTERIVLEFGIDAPGDMEKLLTIVQPSIGVFLNAAPVHLAQFESIEEIAAEKSKLIESLPETGTAILNADDKFSCAAETAAKKVLFGASAEAELCTTEIKESLGGISAKISWKGETADLQVPILGKQNLPSLLAAIAVGISERVGLQKSVEALKDFQLSPGRLNLLEGLNGSKIIDGSYNSNPMSLAAAMETFGGLETSGRKIAVLGQMNELGEKSEEFHCQLAQEATKVADIVVGVFGEARHFTSFAEAKGISAQFFDTAEEAGEWLKKEVLKNDLVLVKGSQNNVYLERAVGKILQNPEDRRRLCRQEKT